MANLAEQKYIEAQGGQPAPDVQQHQPTPVPDPGVQDGTRARERKLVEAYILGIPLGWLGAHHFYLRRPGWGCLYLFTLGMFGVGWVVDWFRMPCLVKKANRPPAEVPKPPALEPKSLSEAYLLWFPLGLFGAHHFYLRQWGWAYAYFFTFGLLGLGWLMDLFVMPLMVKEHNAELEKRLAATVPTVCGPDVTLAQIRPPRPHKRVSVAYRLCLFPVTGLLGAHHYYLGRVAFGLYCTFTLGGFGVTWFSDWFRLKCIVKDANRRLDSGKGFKERRLDDCYFVAIPGGLFGAHHFYLRRVGWGFLYLFTVGIFGVGWIVDLVRMYRLVRDHKEELEAQERQIESGNVGGDGGFVNPAGLVNPAGPPEEPRYVYPPGVMPPQQVQAIAPGAYAITPAPPYTALPGPTAPTLPHVPPGYEAGLNSWSTIASSDVDQPPSYEYSTRETKDNEKRQAALKKTQHYCTKTPPPMQDPGRPHGNSVAFEVSGLVEFTVIFHDIRNRFSVNCEFLGHYRVVMCQAGT